jgi:hypothetical protein
MLNCQQAISVLLCAALVVSSMGLDGCKKNSSQSGSSAQSGSTNQAPAATYASPTPDQLYQLVAPIALFPDNLVAQVLAGSTFPDQITAAWQWLQQNSSLKGQQLMQAVDQQPWDASVKGLTQFSDVLQQMASNLSWTSALGDAYFNIPQSVMNAVQVMRQRAYQAGNLKTGPQQNVSVQNEAPGAAAPAPAQASSGQSQVTVVQSPPQTIVIQPSQPDVVYVPTYNPTAVYGAPVAPYPGYSTGDMVATGLISFGVGMMVGAAMSGGCCGWGYNSWGCGWHNSSVTYNRNVYVSNSNTFVNRNNYYNRNNVNYNNVNRNNINANNINRNNINTNNINRNNLNANNVNRNNVNNRANNFNQSSQPRFDQRNNQPQLNQSRNQPQLNQSRNEPQFNQSRNQPQFNQANTQQRLQNQPNLNQQNRAGAQQNQPNLNQQNRAGNLGQNQAGQARSGGLNQNQPGGGGFNQNQRTPERGYGDQPTRNSSSSALGNYNQGGNARANSARGQQSLEGGGARAGGGGGGARTSGGGGGREARGRGR